MKHLLKFILLMIMTLLVQYSFAYGKTIVGIKIDNHLFNNFQNDTTFNGSYAAISNKVYLYSKPNLTSKTKNKLPQNVILSVSKKSGDFVYGEFSISTDKTFSGWFRLKELEAILFTAPKTTNRLSTT